jgi:rfaE bifunctional protein nucleotidyltransferase chain/domain
MKVFYEDQKTNDVIGCIWTNGCYDILHRGHIELFKKCRTLSDHIGLPFFVGIDSDSRVSEMKGRFRPINSHDDRAEILMSIKGIDRVYIYNNENELNSILKDVAPHTMVIGDDYRGKKVVGAEHSKNILYFPKISAYSTSNSIKKMKEDVRKNH